MKWNRRGMGCRKDDGENRSGEEKGGLTGIGKKHVCVGALQGEASVREKWVCSQILGNCASALTRTFLSPSDVALEAILESS